VDHGPAAPALADRPVKFQHAELQYSRVLVAAPAQPGLPAPPGVKVAVPAVTKVAIVWTTSEEEVKAEGWENLADKLKAPAPKKEGSETVHKLRVLDRLGSDGWEVTEHTEKQDFAATAVWRFKRRLP
jgi:hypothetical protein